MLEPITDSRSQEFFDAAKRGELLIQRCPACARFQFYPRRHCLHCGSLDVEWAKAAGTGTLHTFSVVHRTPNPEFAEETPYVFAIVELDEGVRLTTRIVDVPFEELRCELPVEVVFTDRLPMFTVRR